MNTYPFLELETAPQIFSCAVPSPYILQQPPARSGHQCKIEKYLVEDDGEPEVKDLEAAKKHLKDFCYLRFAVEDDIMKRGRLEGLLSYLFHLRYMEEEH